MEELNRAIQELLELHNNAPMKREKCSRRDMFTEMEQSALSPLPAVMYQLKHFAIAAVHKTSHVYLSREKHYYSVPFHYIGKKVTIIYSKSAVEICHIQRRIAFHQRVHSRYGYTTLKEQMPSSHQYMTEWNPNRFISWVHSIGVHREIYY